MMKNGASVLTILLTILCISMTTEDLINMTTIPEHLLECYQNPLIYKRQYRLPMTMTTLIELIRNIEQHPDFNMDLRDFALLLTDRFRVDGIEEYSTVKRRAPEDQLFKVIGYQFNKNFFLRGLIPESSRQLPNGTLSLKEKCSLHFMLSSSIETRLRGDERTFCSVVNRKRKPKNNARVLGEVLLDVMDTARNTTFLSEMMGSIKRAPRKVYLNMSFITMNETNMPPIPYVDEDIIPPEPKRRTLTAPIFSENIHSMTHVMADSTDQPRILNARNFMPYTPQIDRRIDTRRNTVQDSDSNFIPPWQSVTTENVSTDSTIPLEQDMFQSIETENDQHSDSNRIAAVFPIIIKPGEIESKERLGYRTDYSISEIVKQRIDYPESACPIENGVVYTRWGSVSAGTVLAGIAAGLAQEDVFVYYRGDGHVLVNNLWAATLAGDLAEASYMQFSKGLKDVKIGVRGNWTDSRYPEWYLIESPYHTEMTDAEIRGGIDGLILGKNIKIWNEIAEGTLRLSSLLERYYSTRGVLNPEYQACRRANLYSQIVPVDNKMMNRQVFNFASTLSFGPQNEENDLLDGRENSTNDAVERLNGYISENIVDSCPASTTQDPFIDLYVVIDCGWSFEDISNFLVYLREEVKAPSRSRFTVFSGQEFKILMNSMNIAMDIADYRECVQGMNLKRILERDLELYFSQYLDKDSDMPPEKTYAIAVLFVPHSSTVLSSLKAAQYAVKDFRKNSPDITFLYLTSDNLATFQLLVDNMQDVFRYSDIKKMSLEPIITRLKKVPRRITNPSCVPPLSGTTYNTYKYVQVVDFGGTNYYRLHPRYLFPAGDIRIKVTEEYGMLEVCYSRKSAQPHRTTEATECKTTTGPSTEIAVNVTEACMGIKYVLDCPPLYISVQSIEARPRYQCTRDPGCRSSDDILYTVSFTGLKCGVGHFLANPFTVMLEVVLTLSRIFYQKHHVCIPTKILVSGDQS